MLYHTARERGVCLSGRGQLTRFPGLVRVRWLHADARSRPSRRSCHTNATLLTSHNAMNSRTVTELQQRSGHPRHCSGRTEDVTSDADPRTMRVELRCFVRWRHFRRSPRRRTRSYEAGSHTPDAVVAHLASVGRSARVSGTELWDGAVLKHLARLSSLETSPRIERLAAEAAKARRQAAGNATVRAMDFSVVPPERRCNDGVAGTRRTSGLGTGRRRTVPRRALRLLERVGIHLSRLTNAWVLFVVASSRFWRSGRADALASYFPRSCCRLCTPRNLRVALLRSVGRSQHREFPAAAAPLASSKKWCFCSRRSRETVRQLSGTAEVNDASQLSEIDWERTPAAPALRHDHEKWTKYFRLRRDCDKPDGPGRGGLSHSAITASVDVGIRPDETASLTMSPSSGR